MAVALSGTPAAQVFAVALREAFDAIAREPQLAAQLRPEERAALFPRAMAIVGALAAPAITTSGAAGSAEDRILDVATTAKRMDVSEDYVYRHHGRWPFTVRRGRKLGFSEQGLTEYLRHAQQARP